LDSDAIYLQTKLIKVKDYQVVQYLLSIDPLTFFFCADTLVLMFFAGDGDAEGA
jgi:hypothetical protein